MEKRSDRPARNRSVLVTLELCVNRGHGPHGAVEVITSLTREPWNVSKFWDLGEHGHLSAVQLADMAAYVMKEVQETAICRVNVQEDFQGVLST